MNYKDLNIKISYHSKGEDSMLDHFLDPVLKYTKLYKRCAGFFSASSLLSLQDSLIELARNKGKIQLICSPKLSQEDIETIKQGYEDRETLIKDCFSRDFLVELEETSSDQLQLLYQLIVEKVLDIKICVTDGIGIYHDKLGILEDHDGNVIVFYGSANASAAAHQDNYEKIRVVKGWVAGSFETIKDEQQEFDSLWNSTNEYAIVYDFNDAAKNHILKETEHREAVRKQRAAMTEIKLRDYQEEAVNAWVDNYFHGFYVMATGTGKTWTAIFSAKRLLESHAVMIVICAPYKHLIKQWAEDLEVAFSNARIIMVSSENPKWEEQIKEAIIQHRYDSSKQIIVMSTIQSFQTERFKNAISKSEQEKLLIVDEAHRFTNRDEGLKDVYNYMLGLSATPFSGKSSESGKALMDYFGGQVYNLPIEYALDKGFLVPYDYFPIFVSATEQEEDAFAKMTAKMASCFKDGVCIDPEKLAVCHRSRLRIISMAQEKLDDIYNIIDQIGMKDHFIVYCGDGRLFDEDTNKEINHVRHISDVLTEKNYHASRFTAQESMKERMALIDAFDRGEISTLVAIRCLDEGVNIPSIHTALILSSNDNYREFVQRRGRILRKHKGKDHAAIYDVVVLPSSSNAGMATIELRRFYEYGKLSRNWSDYEEQFNSLLKRYYLEFEDISAFNYDEEGGVLDE